MKRNTIVAIILGLCAVGDAHALGLYGYASVRGGISYSLVKTINESDGGFGRYVPSDKRNFSFNPNLGMRIVFNNWRSGAFRLEAGYSISSKLSMHTDDIDYKLENQVGMTNLYFDFYTQSRFKPFLMGGAGYGVLKLTEENSIGDKSSNSDKNFVWALGGGITYILNTKIYFDFMYRYNDFGKLKSASLSKLEYTSSEFLVGARYMF
ncbi:MAG: porin family protein [Alphaproteobacteria bacterium]|nr:porin family protein [Alphaproteobacteria bacterium]